MRVLLVVRGAGAIRRLERALLLLIDRGHEVHVAYETGSQDVLERLRALNREHPRLTSSVLPPLCVGDWADFAGQLRGTIDFARYLEPTAPTSPAMHRRAKKTAFLRVADGLEARSAVVRRVAVGVLRHVERCLPAPASVVRWLEGQRPDVLLVTPLVGIASSQADVVRAGRALGIPVVLPVLSWDNLTGKGVLRDTPGLSIVWNSAQADELHRLHHVPGHSIKVAGAVEYDGWPPAAPCRSRAEWCAARGLDPARPVVVYVCSSPFIAGDETPVVRQWLTALRTEGLGPDAVSVLVRPHPQNAAPWAGVELGDAVIVDPVDGGDPVLDGHRTEYLDTLLHAAAVVGLNTSAMVEGSLFDAPVLTFVLPETAEKQTGTGHFHHLVGREGHVRIARSLDEHAAQLRLALGAEARPNGNSTFAERFLRPNGAHGSAAAFVDALEHFSAHASHSPARPPLGAAIVRRRIAPVARHYAKRTSFKRELDWTRRRAGILADADAALEAALTGAGPVLAGPYLGEVGHELLYWVPFLRWAVERRPELRDRLVAISRGGAAAWYRGIADRYVDLYDVVTADELRQLVDGGIEERGGRKQLTVTEAESRLLERIGATLGTGGATNLHPSIPLGHYRLIARFLPDLEQGTFIHRPLTAPETQMPLPDRYIAIRSYANSVFPLTARNQAVVDAIVLRLVAQTPVVWLAPGGRYDDHEDFRAPAHPDVVRLPPMDPRSNLAEQTAIIARSTGFVGTYGGSSYLPLLLGVPGVALADDRDDIVPHHLQLAERLTREPGFGSWATIDCGDPHETASRVVSALLARGALPGSGPSPSDAD